MLETQVYSLELREKACLHFNLHILQWLLMCNSEIYFFLTPKWKHFIVSKSWFQIYSVHTNQILIFIMSFWGMWKITIVLSLTFQNKEHFNKKVGTLHSLEPIRFYALRFSWDNKSETKVIIDFMYLIIHVMIDSTYSWNSNYFNFRFIRWIH